jgi:RNase P/RNase MRP subunit p30
MKFFYFTNSSKEIKFPYEGVEYIESKIVETYDNKISDYRFDLINFKTFKINKEIFTKLKEKNIPVELNCKDIIDYIKKGKISKVKQFIRALESYNVPFKFNSRIQNKYEFKSPKEIMILGEHLGLTQQKVKNSLKREKGGN